MSRDRPLTGTERLRAKLHHLGLGATGLMLVRKALRPWSTRRHRRQATSERYAVGKDGLAAALGTSAQGLEAAVAAIRQQLAQRMPVQPGDRPTIRERYRQQAPDQLRATLEAADQICRHVFDLLGSGPVALGDRIDWHRDFKSGFRWDPTAPFMDIAEGRGNGVDIKVPWELSRGQQVVLLAQAAWLSGESRYARECVAQMADWIAANPAGYGVNWACPMDVAIRAVNWLWALSLLAPSSELTEAILADIVASLVAHGRFLTDNLEVREDGVTTNHYLADIVGLLYLGLCLKEVGEAGPWRTLAVGELVREMDRQVLPDGVHYESSLSYHRLVAEMFLSSALLCRRHGVVLPPAFHERLKKMCEFVWVYTKPNGLAPQVGDGDNGRLHILSGYGCGDVRDHRHLLAAGGLLYDRTDWIAAAGPWWIESLWLGGADRPRQGEASVDRLPQSRAFATAGFYILRDRDDYVLFNCNAPGTNGVGTHKHNDLLSVELQLGGEDILVDPGCFLYTSDPQAYERFRRTAHHSTVMVDEAEQNRVIPGKLFCLHPDSRVQVLQWDDGPAVQSVVAEHDGYGRLTAPVIHRRDLRYDRDRATWLVVDRLTGSSGASHSHRLEWTLVFAPHCRLEPIEQGWSLVTPRGRFRLDGPHLQAGGQDMPIRASVEQGLVAPRYGVTFEASLLRWQWDGPLPVEGRFSISRQVHAPR